MLKTSETISPGVALAMAYAEFVNRFDTTLLWPAFEALTLARDATLAEQHLLRGVIVKFVQHLLDDRSDTDRTVFWENAMADPEQDLLRMHICVRWWRARDAVVAIPDTEQVIVPSGVSLEEHALKLLCQMMYVGTIHTTPPSGA